MRLFKVMFTQDMRTKKFQCHIKDYVNKEEVRGVDANPVRAFCSAEKQLSEPLCYITNPDAADYDED